MTTGPTTSPTPAAPSPVSEELAYLEAHGEDIADLRQELEGLLPSSREPAPAPVQTREPSPAPSQDDNRLPIARDGSEVKLAPQAQQTQTQQTPMERALDPLSPDSGPRTQPEQTADAEPGEVMIDGEGKLRDAKTGRYVPHQAFHAERESRKAAQAEAAKLREESARVQERLSVLTEIIQGQETLVRQQHKQPDPAPEPEKEIDPETDVFAAVKQMQARDKSRAEQVAEIERVANQRIDAMQQEARYRQDALQFALKQPDFPEAYRYFNERRREELKLLGFNDESKIDQHIMAEERALMTQGFRTGGGPAQMIYSLARNRGYQPKAAEPAPTAQVAPAPTPAPPPAPAAPMAPQVSPDAAQAVLRVQNGQQASTSLTGAGGTGGEGMTVQQLADMSEEDFQQFATKIGVKKLDRLLGGKG